MEISINFTFDAAHRLPFAPEGHKCSRLHGHTYHVSICILGDPDPVKGWVMDFSDVKAIAKPHIDALDHTYLNEIKGLENPTSENIAIWLWRRLHPDIPMLSCVIVKETPTSTVVYKGDPLDG